MFRLIFRYIQIIHDYVYYRKVYYVNRDKVPPAGNAVIIAGSHQNAINDPLALEFCFSGRKFNIFARASLFASRFGNWFFRGLNVLPAYRLRTDGEDQLKNNYESFGEAGAKLAAGEAVGIFPEGTNQYRHFLGEFSQTYLRLAFETAKKCNYEKEIYIQPVSVHYSDYFKFRADMMTVCGEPLALSPYYAQYAEKPRTTCRKVNAIVRQRVECLMLNIKDEENYEAIEYLCKSYGRQFANSMGLSHRVLPEKLRAEQMLVAKLEEIAAKDPERAKQIYADTLKLKEATLNAGLRDNVFDRCPRKLSIIFKAFAFLLLLPVFIAGLYPNLLCYLAPIPFVNKFKKMGGPFALFQGGLQLGINALFVVPLSYLAVFLADLFAAGWQFALVHLLLLPLLGVFAWDYSRQFKKFLGQARYSFGKTKYNYIAKMRESLFNAIR